MDKIALIVDDDRTERRMISEKLRSVFDLSITEAENGHEALRVLEQKSNIVVVILDLDMPVMGGQDSLKIINKKYPHIPVIILTGHTDTQSAVDATKSGAADFLSKPIESARLDVSVRNALKMSLMNQEISRLKRHTEGEMQFSDLIGSDNGIKDDIKIGLKAAACHLPVLIMGETGTGKEMFARAIHGESKRSGQPFIAINCGAIPEKLVESTLFGHEKGAFTGATTKAAGKFQEANGGTIFLDEIGELPLEAQVKLLRTLQQGEVEPVGAGKPVSVDVRIISATNRDLAEEVREGRFREDLYFRLNVLNIELPSLQARKVDIPAMVDYFIEQFCASHHSLPKGISPEAMKKLQNYNWPGNVRELENIINRTMALSDHDRLEEEDFSFVSAARGEEQQTQKGIISPLRSDGSFKSLRELEQEIVALALMHHDHNISQTARTLGIAKSTLYTKIETLADLKSA